MAGYTKAQRAGKAAYDDAKNSDDKEWKELTAEEQAVWISSDETGGPEETEDEQSNDRPPSIKVGNYTIEPSNQFPGTLESGPVGPATEDVTPGKSVAPSVPESGELSANVPDASFAETAMVTGSPGFEIPPAPEKTIEQGDKTPAYVAWKQKYGV